jgi:PAS domain S-box-containing protein
MNLLKEIINTGAVIDDEERLTFLYLPDYARYLLANKVRDMALRQHELSKELNIPLLRYFSHLTEDQLIELGQEGTRRLLRALENNDATNYIRLAVASWVNDQIPEFSRNQLLSEDISLISYMRRKIFREFVGGFTEDVGNVISILDEMDRFLSWMDKLMFKTLFAIQQELYEQSQEINHIGNWLWDFSSNNITWSKELFRIYELEPRELVSFDISVYNHPDDAAMVMEQMRVSRETKQPHDFYYRVALPSGNKKYLHARGQVLTNEQGVVERMFGTLQDVTAQKENEETHREYENFIQKITDITPSLIAVYNVRTGEYLYLNQALETLLGYDPKRALEQGAGFFMDIVHPDDLPRILDENSKALKKLTDSPDLPKSDQTSEFRYRLRHNNGEYRWFHTYGTIFERDKNNEIETVINISNDITEQITNRSLLHQKSEEIVKQQERYYKMIDEVEDYAILLLTKDGLIENWNKGAEKIKGYRAEEIVGQHLRVFYPKEDQENHLPEKLISEAANVGKASHEGWRVRKDGSHFWANVVITALHDGASGLIGFTKVTRDLTARKLAEENLKSYTRQLEQKNRLLEAKNKELESFTYIASHDLQEPVRKIKLWCNRLISMELLPDKVGTGLAKIHSSGTRMQELIEGLLKYSQMDDVNATAETLDLNRLLGEVLEDFAERLEEKHAEVDVDELPVLPAVRLQIQQLFANLISNSIKYSKTDVPLKITVSYSLVSTDEFPSGNYHQISFADNGVGFKQDFAERIFEIFQRLDTSGNSGTGIGLAICKKIVGIHGGKIWASSEPGVGTTFYIRLPA